MDKIFKAMADINRRKILTVLRAGNLTVLEILSYLPIKQATLSSHLAILKKAELVESEVKGKQRIYKLKNETLTRFVKELNRFSEFADTGMITEIIIRRK